MTDPIAGDLSVRNLKVSFAGTVVVQDLSLDLPGGEAAALVGSNGAGKSTTLLALAGGLGVGAQTEGEIRLGGQDLTRSGRTREVSLVPEREKVFTTLTVGDNLRCAGPRRGGVIGCDDVLSWFPRLAQRRTTLAGNLSGGEQQMLAIGMALLGSPRLLLLDEPTLGLAVPIIEQLCETLAQIRNDHGLTVLVAEADSQWLVSLAESAFIIQRGRIISHLRGDLRRREADINEMLLGAQSPAGHLERVSEAAQ